MSAPSNKIRLKKETLIFAICSIVFFIFSITFKDKINDNTLAAFLLFFVVIFGLPHGALDTLLAKKYKIYKSFSEFIVFNLAYIFIAIIVFISWKILPFLSLCFFLIMSGYHFSEDWNKYDINIINKLSLGYSVINLPFLFHSDKVELIYFFLTNSSNIYDFYLIKLILALVNIFLLIILLLRSFFSLNILIQCSTIIITAYALEPIFFFICYFCFFHSYKNYTEATQLLEKVSKNKIKLAITFNTFFSIFIGIVVFKFFMEDFNLKNLSTLIFIGLAALTVPHMILRSLIKFK